MTVLCASETTEIICPSCQSDAVYRYGKAWTGKQRFLCLMCGRQFTFGAGRSDLENKPDCPVCGKTMHLYKREENVLRFRCSAYPKCRTFKKLNKKDFKK